MANLNSWLSPAVMDAMGWAIIHSFWQCLAVAALAAVLMALSRRSSVRYLVGVGALAAMLAAPVATFFLLMKSETPVQVFLSAGLPASLSSSLPDDSKLIVPGVPATTAAPAIAAPSPALAPAFETRAFSLPDSIPPNIFSWLVGRGFAASRSLVCAFLAASCFWSIAAAGNPSPQVPGYWPCARRCSTGWV